MCIAVYFKFLASKALHCTPCHAEHWNVHPRGPFPGRFVVRMPSCWRPLCCVVRPLSSNGGEGAREPSLGGTFPGGGEGPVTRGRLLDKGGGPIGLGHTEG